jgi:ketopantoate reductase
MSNICVIGAGRVGSFYGASLAKHFCRLRCMVPGANISTQFAKGRIRALQLNLAIKKARKFLSGLAGFTLLVARSAAAPCAPP